MCSFGAGSRGSCCPSAAPGTVSCPPADASEGEVALCQERTSELSALVNEFILRWVCSAGGCRTVLLGGAGHARSPPTPACSLAARRRTNTLLSQHLPPKVVEIVCCRLTPLQLALYCHFLESKVRPCAGVSWREVCRPPRQAQCHTCDVSAEPSPAAAPCCPHRRPRARCLAVPARTRRGCCLPSPACASCSTTRSSSMTRCTGALGLLWCPGGEMQARDVRPCQPHSPSPSTSARPPPCHPPRPLQQVARRQERQQGGRGI